MFDATGYWHISMSVYLNDLSSSENTCKKSSENWNWRYLWNNHQLPKYLVRIRQKYALYSDLLHKPDKIITFINSCTMILISGLMVLKNTTNLQPISVLKFHIMKSPLVLYVHFPKVNYILCYKYTLYFSNEFVSFPFLLIHPIMLSYILKDTLIFILFCA